MKKRHLIIYAIIFLAFLILLGTFLYQILEGWNFIDAFYFTVMTITTVGFGDLVPTHHSSKIITSFYSLISIPLVIFIFGVVISKFIEDRLRELESRLNQVAKEEKEIEETIEKK